MKRYICNFNLDNVEKDYHDVVIIGSGLAGLYTALNVREELSCLVISKNEIDNSSSYLAQGGIAAVFSKDDYSELHIKDTLNAGGQICNKEAVEILVKEGPKEIEKLISVGIQFDKSEEGKIHVTREGGHSKRRIVHCGGDATGREVVRGLFKAVTKKNNVVLKSNVFLVDIITLNNKTVGILVYDNGLKACISPNIVICSGGIGQVYEHSTNPKTSTGDGIAAAIRANAIVENMEFIQFHPTAFCAENSEEKSFLISEAVRGEGGVLINQEGIRFMAERNPLKDLAPRDIVAREIYKEMKQYNTSHVYLDITSKSEEYLSKRFPTIYNECLEYGINIAKDYIPVCPVQHYFMGGIKTNLNGMSNIEGLYACGEAACTGVHGANRLASNSLLECLVFGRRCAEDINENNRKYSNVNIANEENYKNKIEDVKSLKNKIKRIMSDNGAIIRNEQGLSKGIEIIYDIIDNFDRSKFDTLEHMEAYNMALLASQILRAALKRKVSIGAHFREDT